MKNRTKIGAAAVALSLAAWVTGCGSDGGSDATSGTGSGGGTTGATGSTGGGEGGATGSTGGGEGGSTAAVTGAGGATGSGGSGGAGASQACQDCFATVFAPGSACATAIEACDGDPACDTWKNCAEACFTGDDTAPCYAACDAAHPHDAALSEPLFDCMCPACAGECPATCAGH